MNKFKLLSKLLLASVAIVLLAAGCNSPKTVIQTEPDLITDTTVDQAPEDLNQSTPSTSTPTQSSTQNTAPAATLNTTPKTSTISYSGVDGKTALELLKAGHKVETQNYSGVGEFVKAIDGVTPDKDHFWAFYVNGKTSTVGAGGYTSKSSDKIEWKLDKIGAY